MKCAMLHFDVATFPLQFISMDLIGEFHPPTSRKTLVCSDSNMYADRQHLLCPFENQNIRRSYKAYIDNVYFKFGGSLKMLSDNGTKFKNKMFEQIAKELGLEYKLYTPPYHPASNDRIEGSHAFLKVCIAKHVAPQLE